MSAPHADIALTLKIVTVEQHGFLSPQNVAALAADDTGRLTPLLVRFGGCRLTCPAQDVSTIIAALEAAGDYCRDVSLPAKSIGAYIS
jgi:hypothetical protein